MDKKYGILNVELKLLYVSITRPKTNLIIYDSNPESRNPIFKYWAKLGLVDTLRKGEESDNPLLSLSIEDSETKDKWKALGIKLFKKQFYDSAIMCFEESGDSNLKIRTLGHKHADQANLFQSQSETLLFQAKNDKSLTKHQKRLKKREGKDKKENSIKFFRKAGEFFEKIEAFKNAAQ